MTNFLTPDEQKALGVAPPDAGPPAVGPRVGAQGPAPPVEGPCHIPWQRITEDTLLCRGLALFWGALLTVSADGATAAFYDGVNTSGRPVLTLKASLYDNTVLMFPGPILLKDGLYIDVGANVTEVFLLYAPLRD